MSSASSKFLSLSPGTFQVPIELFALNRQRLRERLQNIPEAANAVVFLQGGDNVSFYDTDVDYIFRQESYFNWTFGVQEPGCYGALNVATGATVLFVPFYPEEYAVWMGPLRTLKEIKEKYDVDEVHYVGVMKQVLSSFKATLLTLNGVNTDSGLSALEAKFEGIEEFNVNNEILFNEIAECRVRKTNLELAVIRYVVDISSAAHCTLMKKVKPGMSEYQCESIFLDHAYRNGGCRHVSYTCICGSGINSAVLHYGHAAAPNDKVIHNGDICLFDMGANYFGYAADITCSYPVNGKFTPDQRLIYEAVLDANLAVYNSAKPGVSWVDMHLLANRVLLQRLKDAGLLQGSVDDMLEAGLGEIFQPHGLGHLLGLDVHDVGGYLSGHPERPKGHGVRKLRTARVLDAGMVLTIEPGCYFIKPLLEKARNTPSQAVFLVWEQLKRFEDFGGVRIEDDVLITDRGVENLTKVPRTVEEIEAWMADKENETYVRRDWDE